MKTELNNLLVCILLLSSVFSLSLQIENRHLTQAFFTQKLINDMAANCENKIGMVFRKDDRDIATMKCVEIGDKPILLKWGK